MKYSTNSEDEMVVIEKYPELEGAFERQVAEDNRQRDVPNCIFLPNIMPKHPVDFVLVGMEPSLGRWAKDLQTAQAEINKGFKDFALSIEDFILHFCVREFLCSGAQDYYVTNLSKGAMKVKDAQSGRAARYEDWYRLLEDELHIVARPEARIISIGKIAGTFLRKKGLGDHVGTILHYSSVAAKYREAVVCGREDEYNRFSSNISLDAIEQAAISVLSERGMDSFIEGTLKRIRERGLTDSLKKLIFTYKVEFDHLRTSGQIN